MAAVSARRVGSTAIVLIACVAFLSGCSRAISGTPTTFGHYSTTDVAGLAATNGPSGPKEGVVDSTRPVQGGNGSDQDNLAANAVTDVENYWEQALPKAFEGNWFDGVERLVSYDSGAPGTQICKHDTAGLANAFYCPSEDAIAWDRGEMLPNLERSFGPMAVVTVLAHEMGHAVQHRAGTVSPSDPMIVSEQQADCFTGAFFRHVAEGRAKHFQVSTGEGLNGVLGVLNYIRDTPGEAGFTGDKAHGSAFDRVTAFQDGFGEGPKRCAEMDAEDVQERTTQFKFWKDAQESDLPVSRENLGELEESLREVFRDTGAPPPSITTGRHPCGDRRTTSPAAYCPETNTVSLNMAELRKIAQPPQKGGAPTGYGDFAAYSQVASRYALSVQKAAGLSLDGEAASLRTACLVGSWSGLLVEDPIGQRNPVGNMRIAPGDVDEGVAALLGEESLIAADVIGGQVPAGFARVEAFRIGFQDGMAACSAKYRS